MRRPLTIVLLAVLALGLVGAAGCGSEEDEHEVTEGDALEIGDLRYTVELTRFLNPDDIEDAEYLVGQPQAPAGSSYLGVFLRIENESDEDQRSASDYVITDIRDGHYEPVDSESPYALDIGASVPADGELPDPDSTAAAGPAAGALLLFLVEDTVIDSRPLKLEIDADQGAGEIELDI